jgi:adenylate kinase
LSSTYNFPILQTMELTNIETIVHIKTWLGSGSINLFGMPYAGKDTHGRELADFFDAPLLGGGDILRGSNIPSDIKKVMDSGELIPTASYLSIVTPYLSKQTFVGRPLILSSVGRWHGEEQGIMQASEMSGHPVKAVIYLRINEATVYRRWEAAFSLGDRGVRNDDEKAILMTRLEEFHAKTIPVIDFYRSAGLLIELDSDVPQHEVTRLILKHLAQKATIS